MINVGRFKTTATVTERKASFQSYASGGSERDRASPGAIASSLVTAQRLKGLSPSLAALLKMHSSRHCKGLTRSRIYNGVGFVARYGADATLPPRSASNPQCGLSEIGNNEAYADDTSDTYIAATPDVDLVSKFSTGWCKIADSAGMLAFLTSSTRRLCIGGDFVM